MIEVISSQSGWTVHILSFVNFLFGLGGGIFSLANSKSKFARLANLSVLILSVVLFVASLAGVALIAYAAPDASNNFPNDPDALKKAAQAIAELNLTIAIATLAGLGIGVSTKLLKTLGLSN